ncbi:hypothetical protein ACN47E_008921 [Coniothyrium glycines]
MSVSRDNINNPRIISDQDGNLEKAKSDCEHIEVVEWTGSEESRMRRKLDFRLVPIAFLLYLLCFIDRVNIGNARIQGLTTDLHLHGFQFNWALTIFFFPYMIIEIPSNLMLKYFGARYYLPALVVSFGTISMCTAFVQNFDGLLAARFFLGIAEGGVIPGIAFYLSCFYKRHELLLRVVLFITGSSLAGAFGGLLAAGLALIPDWGVEAMRMHTWRNIFFFEGVVTLILGFLSIRFLCSSAETATFLTQQERYIARERINREHRESSREKTQWKHIRGAIFNWNNNMCGLGMCLSNISVQSYSLFLPTILSGLGYSAIKVQLYSVAPYAVACCYSVAGAYISDRFHRRGYFILVSTSLAIIGYTILVTVHDNNIKYLAVFFAAFGGFSNGPTFLAWGMNNASGPTIRAVSSAYIVLLSNFGGIIATWIYLPRSRPNYYEGHFVNLGALCTIFILSNVIMAYCKWENKKRANGERDGRAAGLNEHEKLALGYRNPDYRYTI